MTVSIGDDMAESTPVALSIGDDTAVNHRWRFPSVTSPWYQHRWRLPSVTFPRYYLVRAGAARLAGKSKLGETAMTLKEPLAQLESLGDEKVRAPARLNTQSLAFIAPRIALLT